MFGSMKCSLMKHRLLMGLLNLTVRPGEYSNHQNIAIIDWGSVTGTGIRASIRYAAKLGARKLLAIALLSQLPFDEERFLASLTGVETLVGKQGSRVRRCEVKVAFLSRYPTQVYEPRLCPYCRQLDRLSEEERFHPTKLLADFIKDAKFRLRQRFIDGDDGVRKEYERRRISSVANEMLPGFSDTYQVTEMALWRSHIDMARTWTSARLRLHEGLAKLVIPLGKESEHVRMKRRCLIKLLAVEWLWLKREPLSMIKFKRQISKIATNAIKDRFCSETEKLDAIVVLRTASKDSFAQVLPQLFETLMQDRNASDKTTLSLVSQLLYCSFTYLQRDYLVTPTLEPLVDALGMLAIKVHEMLGGPKQTIALRVGRTINSLHQYGRFLVHSRNNLPAPAAWRELKELLGTRYHTHHPVYVAFDALRFGPLESDIEDSTRKLPIIKWVAKRDSWLTRCEPFIVHTLLPLITPLRELFEGLDATVMVGPNQAETLAIVARDIFENLATISDALTVFSRNPRAVRHLHRWKKFVQARDEIWQLLIDPGNLVNGSRDGGSSLIRLLQGCPTDLIGLLNDIMSEDVFRDKLNASITNMISTESRLVFCHEHVLKEGILELLINASKHVQIEASNSLDPSQGNDYGKIPVEMILTEDAEYLCLTIVNSGTLVERRVHGRGLETFAERLNPYGGVLERAIDVQLPWVFGVRISLLKG